MRAVDDRGQPRSGDVTLVLGGAGSGKSVFAESLLAVDRGVVYLATLIPSDDECRRRIDDHQARRPSEWRTIELNGDLSTVTSRLPETADVLFDSLTCYVSSLASRAGAPTLPSDLLENIIAWRDQARTVVVVSDEIGSGVVPVGVEARRFRDVLGKVNQAVAALADNVYLVVAGIPVRVK